MTLYDYNRRIVSYFIQNGRKNTWDVQMGWYSLTPKQQRRLRKKGNRSKKKFEEAKYICESRIS